MRLECNSSAHQSKIYQVWRAWRFHAFIRWLFHCACACIRSNEDSAAHSVGSFCMTMWLSISQRMRSMVTELELIRGRGGEERLDRRDHVTTMNQIVCPIVQLRSLLPPQCLPPLSRTFPYQLLSCRLSSVPLSLDTASAIFRWLFGEFIDDCNMTRLTDRQTYTRT